MFQDPERLLLLFDHISISSLFPVVVLFRIFQEGVFVLVSRPDFGVQFAL